MRTLAIIGIAASAALGLPSHAHSQDARFGFLGLDELMGITKNIYLNVIDEVDGGCWTNAGTVEQEARNILINNDVNVSLEPLSSNRLFNADVVIGVTGYRSAGMCVGSAYFSVSREFVHKEMEEIDGNSFIYIGRSIDKQRNFVLSGPSLNQHIRDTAQEFVYEISSDISEGRKKDVALQYIMGFTGAYHADPVTQEQRRRELREEYAEAE